MSFDRDAREYWEEFILPFLSEDESRELPDIISAMDEILAQGDIVNGTINEENLIRFNQANIMAYRMFKHVTRIQIESPAPNWSFSTSTFYCKNITIENGDYFGSINPDKWRTFENIVDYLRISPVSETEISITFSINGIYTGTKV